jgi:ankyrin repeat protein
MQGRDGRSALHIASVAGNTEVLKVLLKGNAQVNMQDESGISAIMLASIAGHNKFF